MPTRIRRYRPRQKSISAKRTEPMNALRCFFALLLLSIPTVLSAQAPGTAADLWNVAHKQERILNFLSAVTVEPNGDLDVTETIRLVSLGQEINHGIQRDFPTSYRNGAGQQTTVGFTVISVQRDGQDEPWERLSLSNGVRIRIGSADVTLPPGEHVYSIRYRTTRQIAYSDTHDELYWNVTGTGWTFPIDAAEARITLPAATSFGDRVVYTGPQGSTDNNAELIEEKPGYIAFRTNRPLGREEGLTVAVAFPKGVLDRPGAAQRASWWLQDWGPLFTALLASLGLIGYYIRAWWIAGRGPRPGTIIPIFSPPDDLSPAAVRYITNMKFDDRGFSAALVYLAVRKYLHITQEKGGWLSKGSTTLSRTDPPGTAVGPGLPPPEKAMYAKLFSGREEIELKQKNHAALQAARGELMKGFDDAYVGTMFRKNSDWAVYGLLLILLAMLGTAMIGLLGASAVPMGQKVGLPLLAAILLAAAWGVRRKAANTKGCLLWAVAVGLGLAGVAASLATIGFALDVGTFTLFLPLLILPVAISAFWWMYAPTAEGRRVMDRIAGFRQYLSITEEERLESMHPPEKTPELFERYLPYAIALDVENSWAERFSGVLAAAAAAGATAQTASWYSGDSNVWDNPSGFVSNIGSSFASTVSSASASPSSGGGSSGGGSSGGGGGGGGGSGW